jgi:hypothetical protein
VMIHSRGENVTDSLILAAMPPSSAWSRADRRSRQKIA